MMTLDCLVSNFLDMYVYLDMQVYTIWNYHDWFMLLILNPEYEIILSTENIIQ